MLIGGFVCFAQLIVATPRLDAAYERLQQATTPSAVASVPTPPVQGPELVLWQAVRELRTSQLSNDRPTLERNLFTLSRLTGRADLGAWPNFALARAFAELAKARAPVLLSEGSLEGESHEESAWRNLRDAFRKDPEFDPARRFVLEVAVASGDRLMRRNQVEILGRMLNRDRPEADLLLVWGRHLRAEGQNDSALAAFDHSAELGGDLSRIALERARSLSAIGDSTGATRAYWAGFSPLTPAGRALYRQDFGWMLDPDSLQTFDSIPDGRLLAWVHRFWAERDAAAAARPGSRLLEQLRRWNVALGQYRALDPWRRAQFARVEFGFEGLDLPCPGSGTSLYELLARAQPTLPGDIRARESLLDHRGVIYLRHGEPAGKAVGMGPLSGVSVGQQEPPPPFLRQRIARSMEQNESWLYWIDGRWRLIHFRGSQALGYMAPTTMTSFLPVDFPEDWALRARLLPEYAGAAVRMSLSGGTKATDYRRCDVIAQSREDALVGARTDSDSPLITTPWNAVVQTFGVGDGGDGSGRVLVTFAIPGRGLHADAGPEGQLVYPITFRLVAYNRMLDSTIAIDTVRRFMRHDSLKAGEHLAGWFELPVMGGDWQVAVRAKQSNDSAGAYALAKRVTVSGGNGLALSDIVTGIADVGTPWNSLAGLFALNTLGAWPVGGTVELYYEVRGIPPRESYRSIVEVRSSDPKSMEGIRIQGTERSSGAVNGVRKSLALARLKPGSYRLIVTIESAGRRVQRERPLLVSARH
ncbi:MAG: hypothetical protein V4558_01280 [Gemmatimonadota bacterium]